MKKQLPALVFAYGSNLFPSQMFERCPSARFVERANIAGVRLTFAGYSARWKGSVAGLEMAKGQRAHGVIYSLSNADLLTLDRIEGHPGYYLRVGMYARTSRGYTRCFTYALIREMDVISMPSSEYVERITDGYRAWNLPARPLAAALKRADAVTSKRATTSTLPLFLGGAPERH